VSITIQQCQLSLASRCGKVIKHEGEHSSSRSLSKEGVGMKLMACCPAQTEQDPYVGLGLLYTLGAGAADGYDWLVDVD